MVEKPKRFALADPLRWYTTCRSLAERHIDGQELSRIAADLNLDSATVSYVVEAAGPFIEAHRRELELGNGGVLSRTYRRFILRADRIGGGIYEMARQCLNGRFLVRNVVLRYADRDAYPRWPTLSLDRGRVPKREPFLEDAKSLVLLVSELGVADLKIGLVAGCSPSGATNAAAVRRKLKLPDDTPERTAMLCTQKRSGPSLQLVGIEVVRQVAKDMAVVDKVFESVMAFTKVIEPWCFFAP